jgi:hypothetical protein
MKTLWLFFALTLIVSAQEALTNDSIVKMAKAGLSEGIVVSTIQNQPGKYSLTPDDLIKLKQQGVSEKVIEAMVAKGLAKSSGSAAVASQSAGDSTDGDVPQGVDIGVYFKKDGKWEEMLPDVVNWKTGGVLKHIATAGVVKGDVNGHLQGMHSRNSVTSPVEVLVYAPEGVAITEYQLIHLHENPDDSREFRTVTGGILHESGGATRDVIPFEGKKVASRMYKVLLPKIGAGEYGFLPPGAVTSSSSASIGKMYTFRLLE